MLTSCNDGHTGIYSRTGEFSNHGAVEWQPLSPVSDGALNVVWGAGSSMNNHVTGGTYNITGQRLNAADGLPIANSNPGHTIHARLLVLDSSIPGTGDNDDKCVTQILTLSNRTGSDGDVYVRTGRASPDEIKDYRVQMTDFKELWTKEQKNKSDFPVLDNIVALFHMRQSKV